MPEDGELHDATAQLHQAAAAKKCWACGCLHHALEAIEHAVPFDQRSAQIASVLETARARLELVRYDCLGCEVCFPALAMNAVSEGRGEPVAAHACPTDPVTARAGWPPLAGDYTVLRYQAPVAVCTLTDDGLAAAIARAADSSVSIIGTLQTENLGIERIITNVLANPRVRFVVVAGSDSRRAIGHLPGQSLTTLARNGIDAAARIVGASGKRPVLRNISPAAVEYFRRTVEVVDLIAITDMETIMAAIRACAARDPGAAVPFVRQSVLTPLTGYLPARMTPDPAGYFVLYVDHPRRRLSLEHYRNEGLLDTVIEGATAAEVFTPAIERGLLSRLDHAAYLGRELARAEWALRAGQPYVQDAAPEKEALPLRPPETACCGTPDASAAHT